MAVTCPGCGRQYDVTLFQFGQTVTCDCGAAVRFGGASSPDRNGVSGAIPDVIELPIDGILDLHAFDPADVRELLPEYLDACREKGIFRVRIIHGKGTGEMMKTIHALLERFGVVESFALAGPREGGTGATIVLLIK
jgi:hypothetical protein